MEKHIFRAGCIVPHRCQSPSRCTRVTAIAVAVIALAFHAAPVSAQGSGSAPIARGAQQFVNGDGVVIAYAETSPSHGKRTMALAVRTPIPEKFDLADALSTKYTCELILMEEKDDVVRVTGRTSHAVSCSIQSNLTGEARVLDDNLRLTESDVTFENLRDTAAKGMFSYSFHFDSDKWNLSAAKSFYSSHDDQGVSVDVEESISYPKDFGLISMERFDPDTLKNAMAASKKIYDN